ncbi:FG-GAP repeat domain-containing protein [Cerasicoccus fimbriatus]|uniref:FG-GAP repeat domain-containing protein n=1 Tax=Cerasicoccus fimbriatus TaxID=3014554 RepID=UPI0022B3B05F|nr:VCBS repeat-containing protein [Cerasicoccus sp. TK19100]
MRFILPFLLIGSGLIADSADTAPIQITGPEITKIDWSVRGLAQGDVDQDGRTDIAIINNDRARVEIYYQREPGEIDNSSRSIRRNRWEPVLEDARFELEGVASGIAMFDLELGDVTGDGLVDVVFTSKDEPLVAVAQLEKGDWAEKREYDGIEALPWNSTLKLIELTEDYPGLELVALTKNRLVVFAFDEKANPIKLHETFRMESNGMDLESLPGEGNEPLRFSYRVPGSPRALRVIEWDPELGLGAELAYGLDATTPSIAWLDTEAAKPQLVLIEPRTGRLRVEQLQADSLEKGGDWPMEYYSSGSEATARDAYASGDFNGDGALDVVVADSANAQVWLLLGRENGGWKAPQSFPSFQGVESLAAADIDADGQHELFVLSQSESIIGLSQWNGERLTFPRAIGVSGEPEKIVWLPERKQLALISGKNGKQLLSFLSQNQDGWMVDKQFELEGVRRSPDGIMYADLDQNDSKDLLIAVPRDAARYVDMALVDALPEDQTSEAVFEIDGLREIDLANVGMGDINDDGREEMLIASNGFVRAIYLDADKRRIVMDQFNSRAGNDHLSIPHLRDVDGDGVAEMLIFDTREKEFQILNRDEAGIYRYSRSVEYGDFSPMGVLQSEGDSKDLVLLGKNALVRSALDSQWESLQNVSSYESDLDSIVYNQIVVGELNNDDEPEFIIIDGQNNVLEIIKYSSPDSWQSALHFSVFEEDLHYGGRKGAPLEPREVMIGDFTNDGRQDIVLLVHDRLLLYPQADPDQPTDKAVN